MLLTISHSTIYDYANPTKYGLQQLRMIPQSMRGQKILSWTLEIEGAQKEAEFQDQFHNIVWLSKLNSGADRVEIHCRGTVETEDLNGLIGAHKGYDPLWLYKMQTPLTEMGAHSRALLKSFHKKIDLNDPVAGLHFLSSAIAEAVTYETGVTTSTTTADEAIALGAGVCQDHTHIILSMARHLGFPARYVSGYLMMNDRIDQEAGHAWAEIHVDRLGWVGFDVSNRISPDDRYVRVATGLDYLGAAPVTGLLYRTSPEGKSNSMVVNIQVQQ